MTLSTAALEAPTTAAEHPPAEQQPVVPAARPTRSGGLDAVRILGVLAVVAGHVWASSDPVRATVFPWHVPVFFFLTGYLWRSRRSVAAESEKRFRTLGVPYLLWMLVLLAAYSTVAAVSGSFSLVDDWTILLGTGTSSRPFTTFWFLGSLLFVAVIYRLISHLPLWAQGAIAVVGAVAGTLFGGPLSNTPFFIGTACYCLVFVVAGVAARRLEPAVRRPVLLGAAMLVASAGAILLGVDFVDLKSGHLGTPVLGLLLAVAISWGLVLVAEAVFDRLPQRVSDVATLLAVPAIVVVLLHPTMLWILQTPPEGRLLDYVLCVAVPWALGLLIVRTPLSEYLAGVPRVRSQRARRADARTT